MKSYYRHILLTSAVLLAAAACTKTVPEGLQVTDMQINICASEGLTKSSLKNGTFNPTGTKSLLDANTFAADGNRIKVYDYVNGSSTHYIEDYIGPEVPGSALAQATAGVWPFENGPHQWTPGTHKFFGWLAKDVSSGTDLTPESLISSGFSYADQKLTIPAITMGPTTPQFDFMYSDIFTTEPINTPVQLKFSHLFCAVSFGIKNSGGSTVTISEIKIEKLYTTKSAKVTFPTAASTGSSNATVEYIDDSQATYISMTPDISLVSGAHSNIIYNNGWTTTSASTVDDSSSRQYFLMWPQDAEDVFSDDEITYTGTGANMRPVYPESWKISLTYRINNSTSTIRLNFPDNRWSAGKKYHFDIAFASEAFIYYDVVDWDKVENTITFN